MAIFRSSANEKDEINNALAAGPSAITTPSPPPASRRVPDFDFPSPFPFLVPAMQAMLVVSLRIYQTILDKTISAKLVLTNK